MTADFVIGRLHEMLSLGALLAAPPLLVGLVVGVLVAIFQAATQIQEGSLSFLPKLLAIGGVLLLMAPWGLDKLVGFTTSIFVDMATTVTGVR
jgi:flagellar biosynthesis protein FliQ